MPGGRRRLTWESGRSRTQTVHTGDQSIEESAQKVLNYLHEKGLIPAREVQKA